MNTSLSDIGPGAYRHFKGGTVQVLGLAHHSETLEELVVYEALYACRSFGKGSLWVRPKRMFVEEVEHHGTRMPRFTRIETNVVTTRNNLDDLPDCS